ncbi:unnamed protein product [Clonostachys rosea f. rosea IK726]|uniref:Uncharacterized protein n=1 Tax=Clonostachys rosea f. rosea IK726 TaxID=1349383 RepID=A0ACA9UBS8_BIOOC|nr:unnamed protein product [Clonostachys rosea f. rosea IK726]
MVNFNNTFLVVRVLATLAVAGTPSPATVLTFKKDDIEADIKTSPDPKRPEQQNNGFPKEYRYGGY